MERFDVLVIGGGGAGYAAASTAAKLGKRVAMAERWKLGGTCLNVGCVPTKALIRAAQVAETIRGAGEFGIDVASWSFDYARVVDRARRIVRGFSGEGPRESLAKQGIALLEGSVRFTGPNQVDCDGTPYVADRFVICSGSSTRPPELPGIERVPYLTSNEALWIEELPRSVAIVGGSIIGCEFASLWAAFGVDVTIIARRLMPTEDPEVGDALRGAFEARGIKLVQGRVMDLEPSEGRPSVRVTRLEGGDATVTADAVLLATGRQPAYADLNLDAAGVEVGDRGIAVDATMQTGAPHIWAAGDVTGRHMYTHAGDYAAEVAGWNAGGGEPQRAVDWRVVPRPVYSLPEAAAIGFTHVEAVAAGYEVEASSVCYKDISRAILQGEEEGFCKIIADRSNGQILGASIVGAQACELISEIAVAMAGHVSAWLVGDTQHPYPTLSEVVRWTADQIGKSHRPPGEQAPGILAPGDHHDPIGMWPESGSRLRADEHVAARGG